MKSIEKITLIGQVDQDQIKKWKEQFGPFKGIVVDNRIIYMRKPDRKVLSAASKFGQADPLKFNETIINNCKIGGDYTLLENDDDWMAVSAKVGELVQIKEAEVISF